MHILCLAQISHAGYQMNAWGKVWHVEIKSANEICLVLKQSNLELASAAISQSNSIKFNGAMSVIYWGKNLL